LFTALAIGGVEIKGLKAKMKAELKVSTSENHSAVTRQ
jgi:hypothetical protein